MNKGKITDRYFGLGNHTFEVMHPSRNEVYPNSTWVLFCTTAEFDKNFINFYPPTARLFVDGVNQGMLKDILD